MGVVSGIGFHALGKRAFGPIGFLRAFVEGDVEVLGDEVGEAELGLPQETAGEHGVENRAGNKIVVFAEKPEVVIRAVHDEFVGAEGSEERGEIEVRERVDEFIAVGSGDLDEANLLRVGVETVSFSIEGNPRRIVEARHQFVQLQVVINHLQSEYTVKRGKCQREKIWREDYFLATDGHGLGKIEQEQTEVTENFFMRRGGNTSNRIARGWRKRTANRQRWPLLL